jgi:hypothetical protein
MIAHVYQCELCSARDEGSYVVSNLICNDIGKNVKEWLIWTWLNTVTRKSLQAISLTTASIIMDPFPPLQVDYISLRQLLIEKIST